ncbi:MAG TPA: complex I subunit 1 family protein [Acidimicrobiales bacterium]|nr:complex I subunit 1 family protein [Acidimicrobiales bacterium]
MGDPMLSGQLTLAIFLIVVAKVVIAFAFLLVSVMLMIWFERKVISDMQNRIGPNRAGPYGILQTLADGIKLFFKEELIPDQADRIVFRLAPYLALLPALLVFLVVPVGRTVTIAHHVVELQVADPPMGILFVLAMSSVAVYGTMLAGWASGSKYPLLGSIRGSAQMISYEAAMGLTIATVVLNTGSLSTRDMVAYQAGRLSAKGTAGQNLLSRTLHDIGHFIPHWNIFTLIFVPFFIFFIASTAELNRPPFDLVEGEQELVGGFHTEYTSLRFALFFLAEFMNTITMSAIIVTLFFGGPDGPIPPIGPRWIWPVLWFLGKTLVFLFVQVWIRATLPRLRYDQLMNLGWKYLIPLSLAWLLIIAGRQIGVGDEMAIIGGAIVLGIGLLRSLWVGMNRVREEV